MPLRIHGERRWKRPGSSSTPPACRPTSTSSSTRRWWRCSTKASRSTRRCRPTASWARRSASPQVDDASRALAAYLQAQGLNKGDRVAIMMPNVPQYPVAVAAVLRAGFVVVNVNPLYTPRELEHQLKDSGAKAIIILENFATTCCSRCWPRCRRRRSSLTALGDMLGFPKRLIVNYVVRNVKKMVPAFELPGAVRFNDALAQGRGKSVQAGAGGARRHRRAAVHRRHHRREQGRGAAAPQPGGQRAAGRGLVPAGAEEDAAGRADRHRLRVAALSHLRLQHEHDAGHAHGRLQHPDRQPARPARACSRNCTGQNFHSFPAVNTLFNAMAHHAEFNTVDWSRLVISVGGGMAVQSATAKLWLEKTGCPIVEGYGLSRNLALGHLQPGGQHRLQRQHRPAHAQHRAHAARRRRHTRCRWARPARSPSRARR